MNKIQDTTNTGEYMSTKHSIGIAVISFDRPHYVSELISSLEKQTLATDIHIFQDGAFNQQSESMNTAPSIINETIDIFNKSDLQKTLHISENNIGNAQNQLRAMQYMSQNYDYFLIVEDDVVLSPHYIKICFDNKELLNTYFSLNLGFIPINQDYNEMIIANKHWFAELYKSETVEKYILDTYKEYIDLIKDFDYMDRPHNAIREWMKSKGYESDATSQDAVKDMLVNNSGMKRVTATVNRAFYIGKTGMHFSPSTYRRLGFESGKEYIHDQDAGTVKLEVTKRKDVVVSPKIVKMKSVNNWWRFESK